VAPLARLLVIQKLVGRWLHSVQRNLDVMSASVRPGLLPFIASIRIGTREHENRNYPPTKSLNARTNRPSRADGQALDGRLPKLSGASLQLLKSTLS
jgi:hypothetical protein